MPDENKKPRYKHGGISMLAGQIIGAVYSIPYKVLPDGFEDWSPFFESEHTQGLLFGLLSWLLYEMYELKGFLWAVIKKRLGV